MVKPLSFKGDKITKRKKHSSSKSSKSRSSQPSSSHHAAATAVDEIAEEDDRTWATPEQHDDIEGPIILLFTHQPVQRAVINSSSSAPQTTTTTVSRKGGLHRPTSSDEEEGGADTAEDESPQIAIAQASPTMSFLAADAAGAVFGLPAINVLAEDPHTSEPDDMRQVWTIFRPGGRNDSNVALKSSDGYFLSCDGGGGAGKLTAKAVAAGPKQFWKLVQTIGDADADDERGSGKKNPGIGTKKSTFQLRSIDGLCLGIELSDKTNKLVVTVSSPAAPSSQPSTSTPARSSYTKQPVGVAATPTGTCVVRMQNRFLRPRQRERAQASGNAPIHKTAGQKASSAYTRLQLEDMAGCRLTDVEAKTLRTAMREGVYRETLLDLKSKKKHDKFA